mmetsp:Transcript_108594/g.306156  ORF Transcript_108594/g.306156 Transcript_108594/m.306156 type:complete len:316 (-) Transcript_108594:138-1085(-)|eukprot:CAMPEP_0117499170 /NCGR_PEP_ID=MMETSP0784-20121206/22102_1 /TAXON_ID=39447 /ORGANISM="" /LENGTH=315 /DNA_ID=CAMNT_0005294299 /DNA_START=64 /DNA_END=1011 /DNA_ORIENTATION=+
MPAEGMTQLPQPQEQPQANDARQPAKIQLPSMAMCWGPRDAEADAAVGTPQPSEDALPAKVDTSGAMPFNIPPGLQPPPGTPSHGSLLHSLGNCRPCAWFWKQGGCQNDRECRHCHLCPEGELKTRKATRLAMLRLGLATPKSMALPGGDSPRKPTFFDGPAGPSMTSEPAAGKLGSEGSTTCSGSELEMTTGTTRDMTSGSDEDLAVGQLPGSQLPCPPGLKPLVATTSKGSALHGDGKCRPCAWYWKAGSCQNGHDCNHCHLCPQDEIKERRKAKKFAMLRLGLATPKAVEGSQESETKDVFLTFNVEAVSAS